MWVSTYNNGCLLTRKIHYFCALFCVAALLLAGLPVQADPQVLNIPKARSEYDVAHDYYSKLLLKALQKAANGRELPQLKETLMMEQGRAINELIKGKLIDVYWLGTDSHKEENLRAIRIPLERGLMGFRKFIIPRDSIPVFDQVNSLADLQKMVACQVTHWPDTQILEAAGLAVLDSAIYETLFKQVSAHRCDYFPRGYHEGITELDQRRHLYPDLIRYESLLLRYPFAVYFFVSKDNEALAQWIEQGLEKMIDDGELLQHMQRHPLTAKVFPLGRDVNVRRIDIPNPLMPKNTDYANPRYWFQPEDFYPPTAPVN